MDSPSTADTWSIDYEIFFMPPIKCLRALYISLPTGTLGPIAQHVIKCQIIIVYRIQNVSVPYFPP
jgi:hypothetical protein